MRIERLQIDGFGHFHGRDFGPFDSPLTVLLGLNEAGKSTTLDFIRTMLFGFPPRGREQYYPPLAGGQHGGKITLRGEDGRRYIVDRVGGTRGGSVRITTGEGQIFETDAELRRLLGQATEAMYGNVFAFGLGELQAKASLQGAEVSGQIYSAGLGAANLPRALKKLADGADAVFKPGGSNQKVAELLTALQGVDARLEEAQGDSAEYGRLTARLALIAADLDSASVNTARGSRRSSDLARLRKGWAEWLPLVDLRSRRAALPTIEHFPQSALVRLETGEKAVGTAKIALHAATLEADSAASIANQQVPGEALLADEALVEQIRRQRGSFDDSIRDLPKRQHEAAVKQRELQASLAALGANWDAGQVLAFDLSIARRDEVEQWRQRLEQAERDARESQITARADALAASEADEKLADAQQAVAMLPEPERDAAGIGERKAALRETRTAFDQFLRAKSSREEAELRVDRASTVLPVAPQKAGVRSGALAAAAVALVAIASGFALGGEATILGLLLGVPALGIAAFTAKTKPRRLPNDRASGFEDGGALARLAHIEAEALARLHEVCLPLGTLSPNPAGLDAVELELESATTMLNAWTAAQDRVAIANRDHARAARRAVDSQELSEERDRQLSDLRGNWQAWLARLGLPESLAPATATAVLDRIGYTQTVISDAAAADHRVAAIEQDIRTFRERVVEVAFRHDLTVGQAPATAGAIADELCRRFDVAVRAVARRESARATFAECERRLLACEDTLTEARRALQALLSAAGAKDSEEFRRLDVLHTEANELDRLIREAEQRLVVLSGPGEQFTAFLATLRGTTIDAIETEATSLAAELEAATHKRDLLLDERGSTSARLTNLSSDETASDLRSQRETLLEQLRSAAREWSTLTLSRHLLERARAKYEAERQPDVIKHAQAFFRTVTDGRYQTLVSPLGTNNVTIIGQDGEHKSPEQLSRGTQEQLYLALRFGLIRQFAQNAEPLPVVVDDILVNFDPDRQYRAAKAFAELARTNQVLVFTCQPATAEMFKAADPRTQVIPFSGQARLLG